MRIRAPVLRVILFLCVSIGPALGNDNVRVELSDQEKKFIAEHKPIRVGITPEWAPFSYFTSDGKGAGIDVDVLNLISERTGVTFELVPGKPPWDEIWRMAQTGKLDLSTSTVPTAERERVFKFSKPYGQSLTVIVARSGDLRYSQLSMVTKATAAQPRDHLVSVTLTNHLPALSVMWCDTQKECFEAVTRGKAEVAVADLFTAVQYLNQHPDVKLTICGIIPEFQFPLALAVRREYNTLVGILDKALATISKTDLDTMMSQHMLFTLQAGRRVALLKKRLAYVTVGALVIIAGFFVWNCLIRREVLARRVVEAQLREVNHSLDVFSHSIAHDLRAPLRAIIGLSEALQQDYGADLDETAKDYLNRIIGASARMENLVRDVLAYSQASRAEFTLRDVSLQQIVDQLLNELPPAQKRFVHIKSDLPAVRAHPALLGQCISNLISNALKFVPADQTPKIEITAEQRALKVRLWIRDNGIGIPPQDQQRIFKLFQQGPHGYGGTGIGLAVVAKGVERMAGTLGVESQENEGSAFWIELNKAPATQS